MSVTWEMWPNIKSVIIIFLRECFPWKLAESKYSYTALSISQNSVSLLKEIRS